MPRLTFADGELQYLESFRSRCVYSRQALPGASAASVRHTFGHNALESQPMGESLACFSTASACSIVVLLRSDRVFGLSLNAFHSGRYEWPRTT
jgi:hypothetical protein